MSIGGAIALIAVGAILKWAVTAHVSFIDLQTAGTVIFVVGVIALPLSLLYTFLWSERDRRDRTMGPPPPGY